MNYLLKVLFISFSLFIMGGLITSCSDSDDLDLLSVDDYVDQSMFEMASLGKIGMRGCNEFVFPITVEFPGGNSASVVDYEALRNVIKAWKENNPDAEERPTLAFPLEVITEAGELISVADKQELRELRRECRRAHYDGKRRFRRFFRKACFKPVFPLSIEFPNGSVLEAANAATLKAALRSWKETVENPQGRPKVVYPISVEYEDGSQVEVANKEELIALKDTCDTDEG